MIPDRITSSIGRIRLNLSRDDLPAFFVLAFGFSWAAWLPIALAGLEGPWLLSVGMFGPTLAAVIVLAITQGKAGLREIGRRLALWRVGVGWYGVSLFGTAAVYLAAIGIHRVLRGGGLRWNTAGEWFLIMSTFAQIVLGVLGQETGWRGFALPRLQRRLGALWASVLIGAVWALWYLPLFWTGGGPQSEIPFGLFMVHQLALATLLTWIHNNTGGSLLLTHLYHAASITAIGLLPLMPSAAGGSMRPLWLGVGLLVIAGAVVVALCGPERLTRRSRDRLPQHPRQA